MSPRFNFEGFINERGGDTNLGYTQIEGVSHVLDLSEGSSKLIPIHEEPNHQIVHLFRLGETDRAADQSLDPRP